MVSLGEALAGATRELGSAGVEQPRREARLLAAHLLGAPATALAGPGQSISALADRGQPFGALAGPGQPIDGEAWAALVARRVAREPLAFITGQRGFWTLDLAVSPDTLVPRPDSETLIEAALAAFPARNSVGRILDLGTGTGCLLLAALSEFAGAFGVGVDLSSAAVRLAGANALRCGLAKRASFVAGDWAQAISAPFDLILCNPPYIATADLAGLMPEVRLYEPSRALDGGPSGLAAYQRILPGLPALLAPGGVAILELGAGQLTAVSAVASRAGLTLVTQRADLGGIARALVVGRGEGS